MVSADLLPSAKLSCANIPEPFKTDWPFFRNRKAVRHDLRTVVLNFIGLEAPSISGELSGIPLP